MAEDLLPVDVKLLYATKIPSCRQITTNEFFELKVLPPHALYVFEITMEHFKNYRMLNDTLPLSEVHLTEQMAFCAFPGQIFCLH